MRKCPLTLAEVLHYYICAVYFGFAAAFDSSASCDLISSPSSGSLGFAFDTVVLLSLQLLILFVRGEAGGDDVENESFKC